MDGCGRAALGYSPPRITDYGTLVDLTADGGAMAHVGLRIAAVTTPVTPGGGGGGLETDTPNNSVLGQGDSGGDGVGGDEGGGAGGTSGGGGGGGGSGGGGGGKLPFTGFAAGALGAVGAGLSAGGLALRERLRRKK
jgi:hypothetical protein